MYSTQEKCNAGTGRDEMIKQNRYAGGEGGGDEGGGLRKTSVMYVSRPDMYIMEYYTNINMYMYSIYLYTSTYKGCLSRVRAHICHLIHELAWYDMISEPRGRRWPSILLCSALPTHVISRKTTHLT